MSEAKSSLCCASCLQCCCPSDKTGDKYPNIQYKTPAQANIAVGSPQFSKVPLSKVFDFHQPRTESGVHPLITSDTESASEVVVSEQPKTISRPTSLEYGSSVDEPSPRTVSTPSETLPTLEYSVYYDLQRSSLTVHLQQAYNLPSKAPGGKCDSYVVVYLLPNKKEMFESRVEKRTLNPMYDQVFVFSGLPMQSMRRQVLLFKVFEHSRFSSRELLGIVSVPLESADIYGVTVRSSIEQKERGGEVESLGDILFSLTYKPHSHTLYGILLKATSLKRQDIGGSADPYIKVHVYHKERRVHKWKSQVKKNTLAPVFNEAFQFDIFNMDIEDIFLELIIMDYDRFSRDDLVGEVTVGLSATDEDGRTHWEEIIATPEQAISRWHPIAPPTFQRSSLGSPRTRTL